MNTLSEALSWEASLRLGFIRREERTVLAERRHDGPLLVQRPFYPEGPGVCHAVLVHPPGGIAGGDRLRLDLELQDHAHALITTPGATKWYRSAGPTAQQEAEMVVGEGAVLEYLPQETILYDGVRGENRQKVVLGPDACYAGWEVLALGRQASGEAYLTGRFGNRLEIWQDGVPLLTEYGRYDGDDLLLDSPLGLAGRPVAGCLVVAGRSLTDAALSDCRGLEPPPGDLTGITAWPGVMLARYLGSSTERARHWFIALWQELRPVLFGLQACPPRIWST